MGHFESGDLSYEVTVGKGGDGAVSGTDYHAVSKFNIVIKSGRRSGSNSFDLEPIGDTDWEGDETITIHASGTDGAQSTTLTLTDEGDRPYSGPQVTLSANPSKVSEADGATTVTVTAASAAHSAARTVTVSVRGGGVAARRPRARTTRRCRTSRSPSRRTRRAPPARSR